MKINGRDLVDGGITASVTQGTTPYTYAWSNSASTASITGVAAGTYIVTVTDAAGCTAVSSVSIEENVLPLQIEINATSEITCAGGNTGLVPNADEDCEGTCFGTALPGTPCDDGNPNTINDTWDAGCNCVGIPTGCTEDLVLTINTDDMGSETTWEIYNKVGNVLSASGGPYADVPGGTTEIEQICLPAGFRKLLIHFIFRPMHLR